MLHFVVFSPRARLAGSKAASGVLQTSESPTTRPEQRVYNRPGRFRYGVRQENSNHSAVFRDLRRRLQMSADECETAALTDCSLAYDRISCQG